MHSETINISLSLRWLNNSQEAKYSRAEQPRQLGWILGWICLWDCSQGWDPELRFFPGWGREALGALAEVQQFRGAVPSSAPPGRARGGTLGWPWLGRGGAGGPVLTCSGHQAMEAQARQCLGAGTEPGPLVPELLKAPGSGSSRGLREGASLLQLHLARFPSPSFFWEP